MINFKNTALIFGATLIVGGIVASQAMAAQNQNQNTGTQEQSQELKTNVKCTVGAYGQESTCEASAEGKQHQKQVLGSSTQVAYGKARHDMVDTALDLQTMIAASGVMLAGASAYAIKRKIA